MSFEVKNKILIILDLFHQLRIPLLQLRLPTCQRPHLLLYLRQPDIPLIDPRAQMELLLLVLFDILIQFFVERLNLIQLQLDILHAFGFFLKEVDFFVLQFYDLFDVGDLVGVD